ncbi:hypothetical protein HUJ05_010995, partial [Dendroctonus ponderosae]
MHADACATCTCDCASPDWTWPDPPEDYHGSNTVFLVGTLMSVVGGVFILFATMALCYRSVVVHNNFSLCLRLVSRKPTQPLGPARAAPPSPQPTLSPGNTESDIYTCVSNQNSKQEKLRDSDTRCVWATVAPLRRHASAPTLCRRSVDTWGLGGVGVCADGGFIPVANGHKGKAHEDQHDHEHQNANHDDGAQAVR